MRFEAALTIPGNSFSGTGNSVPHEGGEQVKLPQGQCLCPCDSGRMLSGQRDDPDACPATLRRQLRPGRRCLWSWAGPGGIGQNPG